MKRTISSGNLTIRYVFYQICFFMITSGVFGFATTFLLEKGFHASGVGLILGIANLLSCLIQPFAGTLIDRMKSFRVPQMIAGCLLTSLCLLLVILLAHPPLLVMGTLYAVVFLLISITTSMNASLCAYYGEHSYPINYGIGLGVGSLTYSFGSLILGYVMALLGADWMIWVSIVCLALDVIIVLGYPKLGDGGVTVKAESRNDSVSLAAFFIRYKYFTITIAGVILISMCHFMCENYLITVFGRMGGNSSHVGIALFIACITAAPIQLLFEKVQKKISILTLMRLAGIFYAVKALLLIFAVQIWHVYAIELVQTITYGFIYPSLFYYAKMRIPSADMAKGQTIIAASFTLGTAIGSYAGGRLIDVCGLDIMLLSALIFAAAGAVIINLFVTAKDH